MILMCKRNFIALGTIAVVTVSKFEYLYFVIVAQLLIANQTTHPMHTGGSGPSGE